MEVTNIPQSDSDEPYFIVSVYELKQKIADYLADRGVSHCCDVSVERQGRFFELSGCVDSFWTRSVLFSLVPKHRGQRYIIDKLQVIPGMDNGRVIV